MTVINWQQLKLECSTSCPEFHCTQVLKAGQYQELNVI